MFKEGLYYRRRDQKTLKEREEFEKSDKGQKLIHNASQFAILLQEAHRTIYLIWYSI
jgi:hypothetical protein